MGADEKSAATNSSAAAPLPADAIAIARREFEAVKSARDSVAQPKETFPRISAPELHVPPSGGAWTPQKSTLLEKEKEKKSANWLVDAMEKSADARKDRERGGVERERDRGPMSRRADREKEGEEDGEKRTTANGAEERERKPETAVTNPLSAFLGTWMTPQDFALLKPGIEQGFSATGGASSSGTSTLPGTGSAFPLPGSDASSAATAAARAAAATPRENPYLAMLGSVTPVSSASVAAPPLPAPAANRGVIAPPSLPPVSAPKSSVPDFVKPATDEKYFKQLKRF